MTNVFQPGSRVCAYCRDSGGRNQELSITQQREKIGEYCVEHGLILSRIYEDVARSGSSVVGRGQFLEMMAYFNSGKVAERGIIIWEYARLSRDFSDLMFFVSDIKRQGYIVHSISDSVPPTLEGDLLLGVKAYSNAKFLQDLRRNVKRGLHYSVRTFHAHIATVPIGYKTEQEIIGKRRDGTPHIISHLVIDPATAPLVRKAFEMRATGATYKEIHELLHLYGWHLSYKRLFANRVYTGVKEFGDEVIPDFCPPIITNELWEAVQRVQQARREKSGYNHPRALRSRFWLTGLLFCARCGKPMHGHVMHKKNEKPRDYYICTSKVTFDPCGSKPIRKEILEAKILEVMRSIVMDKRILNMVYEEAQAQLSAKNGANDILRQRNIQELQSTEQKISHILAAIRDIGHSRSLLDELALLERKQADINKQIAEIEAVVPQVVPLSFDDIISNIQQALELADEKSRGIILRGLISKIEIAREGKVLSGKIVVNLMDISEAVIPINN